MDPILVIFSCSQYLLSEMSPILESLTGLSTIRAYREQAGRFMTYFDFFLIWHRIAV